MPRYYFHRTDGFVDNDQEGLELPNLRAARLAALKFAGSTLADDPELVWDGQEYRIEVTDVDGRVLLTVVVLTVDTPTQKRRLGRAPTD